MKGQIVKLTASKFFVNFEGGNTVCIPARGSVKFKTGKLVVGDFVEVDGGAINSVYDRFSKFIRPNVANVELVNIVVATPPKPDYLLIDKMIISALSGGARVVITVNKTDLTEEIYDYILQNYSKCVDKIYKVSTVTGDGIGQLKNDLKGRLCAFFGQSAVGKTSLLNTLFNYNYKVGEVSEKTQRGRHTTTSSQIFFEDGCKIVDTPGFSSLSCEIKACDVKNFYPEFADFSKTCFYIGCNHISEPDCAVKIALENGDVSMDRYMRYIEIYKTLIEEEKYGKR